MAERAMEMGNIYDMNKQLVSQTCSPLDEKTIAKMQQSLTKWFSDNNSFHAVMLLAHENKDYTIIFPEGFYHLAAQDIVEILQNRGKILSYEKADGNAWEIWIEIPIKGPVVYYLFDYTNALVYSSERAGDKLKEKLRKIT